MSGGGPSDAQLAERFGPVFERIAAGAVERERSRRLPYDEIGWLKEAGFGALRVPVEYGGIGASMSQTVALLIELGAADSNLPQALRGHFAFVEGRRRTRDEASRAEWFRLISAGALVGNAQAERGPETGTTAVLVANGDGSLALSGTKYYSTGTIYADWVITAAKLGDELLSVVASTTAEGVTRLDDWDGFGQRMTGSGTTVFDSVRVEPAHVIRLGDDEAHEHASILALFQTVLMAALAGIARAVLRDAVDFVRPRTRSFGVMGASTPRTDPLVQGVVGRLSSLAFSAESLVLAVAARLDAIDAARALTFEGGQGSAPVAELDSVPDSVPAAQGSAALHTAAQIAAFQAQQIVLPTVLEATTLLFEVGGASATSEERALDRHWRNARTIATHNPAIYREQQLGDYELNGTLPVAGWVKETLARRAADAAGAAPDA
ncbi:acyl-CoA dehydrogenase family protein [Compostimonas suwonensis]|uniref:Alkylation response protein AidB-like acyl-CoA dehydrogenase n=1 Tax=Compostimonas suwonensis TaxID=1048394 RepID=A0A2M9BB51_9MICO|nr:acyl-CoA dehydrogenase family protein [Compostimonas suwonensis]PJJ55168.1 alkylation response protein AidB-like acyl-CoA dehydrogenase [Compostimonas suwonensis]